MRRPRPTDDSTLFLRSKSTYILHGYAVLKEDCPEDTELLAAIRRWGDRLFEIASNAGDDFGGRSRGTIGER